MPLAPNLRRSLYACVALVASSGVAWLYGHYAGGPRWFTALSLEIHGGAMMVLLVLAGSVIALHAPTGWREGKNRASGLVLSAVMLSLTATGFLLYYLGNEEARAATSVVHWTLGLASAFMLPLHARSGRRSRTA
jgi:hypothetical protein